MLGEPLFYFGHLVSVCLTFQSNLKPVDYLIASPLTDFWRLLYKLGYILFDVSTSDCIGA